MVLGLGLGLLLASPALAADLNYSSDAIVALTSPTALNLTIKQGSAATSVTINAGSLAATIPASSAFTVTADSQPLTVTGMASSQTTVVNTCAVSGLNTITVTAAVVETVTFAPASQCPSSPSQPTSSGGSSTSGGMAPSPTVSFYADYSTVTAGQSAVLTWTTTNSTSVSLNQGIGTVALSGSKSVIPTSTTAYILTVVGNGGTVTQTVTVAVGLTSVVSPSSTPFSGLQAPETTPASGAGRVVKTSDGTVWFIAPDGTRRAFTSGGAFLSYGYLSFSQVANASAADLALPQGAFIPPMDGKIVCSDRDDSYAKKGTCYLITGGKRAAFTSAKVFTALGFKFNHTTTGDVSFLTPDVNISSATSAHRPGVLVNNSGTIQLVGPTGLMGVPSMSVLNSWGYTLADIVPANSADKAVAQSGIMSAHVTGQLSP